MADMRKTLRIDKPQGSQHADKAFAFWGRVELLVCCIFRPQAQCSKTEDGPSQRTSDKRRIAARWVVAEHSPLSRKTDSLAPVCERQHGVQHSQVFPLQEMHVVQHHHGPTNAPLNRDT